MVDQMNRRWILVPSGFIGSFDLPWLFVLLIKNFHSSSSDSAAIITNAFTAVIKASVLDALDAWKEARVIPLFIKEKEFVRVITCIASILV